MMPASFLFCGPLPCPALPKPVDICQDMPAVIVRATVGNPARFRFNPVSFTS